MLRYDFENSVGFWMIQAAHEYQQAVNEELAPHGITWRQGQVLGCLALYGPLSQAELADYMRVEPPTLVGILDRMERDGWIRRDVDSTDRRRKLIHPTEAAEPVWSKIAGCARRVRARATRGLTAEQLATLKQLLATIQNNLSPLPATKEAG
jgi:MarR family transcriptional regulator, transcriptional regulator for hemolysin